MPYVLLVLHIATAIVFIGGVTVAASVFPRYATAEAARDHEETGAHPTAYEMHRITKAYGRLAIITPIAGLALALVLGRATELWILLSIALVTVGGALLVWRIVPMQQQMLADPPSDPTARRRAVTAAGLLNGVWLMVLILMITKPGAGA